MSSVIFGILLLYIRKKNTPYSMVEIHLIMACFLFSLLRLLFPIEILNLTRTIPVFKIYPVIYRALKREIHPQIRIAHILCGIWIIGSLLILRYQIHLNRMQKRIVTKYGRPAGSITIKGMLGKERRIPLLELDHVRSPFLIGVFHPTIVLPAGDLRHKDLILRHELQHVRSHDLILKCIYELLFILYWWNPLMYFSRSCFGNVLELRNDLSVVKELPFAGRIDYAETLTETARQKNRFYLTAEFSGHFLAARVKSVLNEKPHQNLRFLLIIPLIISIMSTWIVLEPATPPVLAPSQFYEQDIHHPKSYLEKAEHGYNLYIKGNFIGRINEVPDDLKDLKILGGD